MTDELLTRRRHALAAGYELFYDAPLHLVRGEGVLVWDAEGREFLDCYNNVPSVGHCHPRVVAAICRQAAELNTHTRYLHENVIALAEALAEQLPDGISSSWLTCTGTEANDLAIQVCRSVTGNSGMITTEGAYHGNSGWVIQVSPSDLPADQREDWVVAVEAPNTYRGPHRLGEPDLGERYARYVADAIAELQRRGHGVAGMIVDASWDGNGVLDAPDDYLAKAVDLVRGAGGLIIADEVQAGYCRLGGTFYGHQRHGIVPDLVTMGKPMGAGHPVGACSTTPRIAADFAAKRSYFNTFGGNPVSAIAALTVLRIIEDEQLLENVDTTGAHLRRGLDDLASRHTVIGNVQGSGLFWGLDLVADRDTREPLARSDVRRLVTDLVARGLLVGLVGPLGNVVKIRPPLPFKPTHADRALEILDTTLSGFEPHGSS